MHEVVVDVIGAQPGKLLLKELFHALGAADEIMGQLGGDIHLVPQAVFLQDLAQGAFAAGIEIGGVKIIDAAVNGGQHLPFGLGKVDAHAAALPAHTAKAQNGKLVAVFVQTMIHGTTSQFVGSIIPRFAVSFNRFGAY